MKKIICLLTMILVLTSFVSAISEEERIEIMNSLEQFKDNPIMVDVIFSQLNTYTDISNEPKVIQKIEEIAFALNIDIDKEYPNLLSSTGKRDIDSLESQSEQIEIQTNLDLLSDQELKDVCLELKSIEELPSDFDKSQYPRLCDDLGIDLGFSLIQQTQQPDEPEPVQPSSSENQPTTQPEQTQSIPEPEPQEKQKSKLPTTLIIIASVIILAIIIFMIYMKKKLAYRGEMNEIQENN